MDKKLKAKWVRALRSGKYKQGRYRLLSEDGGYCCLGVLAHIQGCDLQAVIDKGDGDDLYTNNLPHGKNAGVPLSKRQSLAQMNDEGKSFKEIAGYIQSNL